MSMSSTNVSVVVTNYGAHSPIGECFVASLVHRLDAPDLHRPASHTIVGGERNCLFHDTMETADGRRHERSRLLGVMGGRHDPEKVLPARPMPGVCVRTTPLPHATRWCCYVTPAAQALRLCRAAVGGIVQTKWVHGGASTRGANMLCMNLPLFSFFL